MENLEGGFVKNKTNEQAVENIFSEDEMVKKVVEQHQARISDFCSKQYDGWEDATEEYRETISQDIQKMSDDLTERLFSEVKRFSSKYEKEWDKLTEEEKKEKEKIVEEMNEKLKESLEEKMEKWKNKREKERLERERLKKPEMLN
jgi:hypothetical protein